VTTIERLRALHDWAWTDPTWGKSWSGEPEKRCPSCDVPWPCALPALLDALGDIEMTVGIYEELAAGIRASRDPRVMREREGAIASLGETLAAKVHVALDRLDGAK